MAFKLPIDVNYEELTLNMMKSGRQLLKKIESSQGLQVSVDVEPRDRRPRELILSLLEKIDLHGDNPKLKKIRNKVPSLFEETSVQYDYRYLIQELGKHQLSIYAANFKSYQPISQADYECARKDGVHVWAGILSKDELEEMASRDGIHPLTGDFHPSFDPIVFRHFGWRPMLRLVIAESKAKVRSCEVEQDPGRLLDIQEAA